MRTAFRLLGILLVGCLSSAYAQSVPGDEVLPGKDKISKDLIMLRDSVNGTIARLSQQEVNASDPLRPAYLKMTQDLSKQKIQLERAIEEVIRRDWSVDLKTKTSQTIDDVRREYKRIQSELSQEHKPE